MVILFQVDDVSVYNSDFTLKNLILKHPSTKLKNYLQIKKEHPLSIPSPIMKLFEAAIYKNLRQNSAFFLLLA